MKGRERDNEKGEEVVKKIQRRRERVKERRVRDGHDEKR